MLVRVTGAAESAALDAQTMAAGVPERALMQRAAAAVAGEIARRFPDALGRGVLVHAGVGNNGGDGWAIARCFAAAGVPVAVAATGEPKSDAARAERELAQLLVRDALPGAGVVVDALLGTGQTRAPGGAVAAAIADIARRRAAGAIVVAVDLPSGVNASTGAAEGAVRADLTIALGTMKRGLLVAREAAGALAVVDIGLLPDDAGAALPRLVGAGWARRRVPPIAADAHKGSRGRLLIVGGAPGMAGATVLAARAAAASGAGMVKLCVAPASVPVVQAASPAALAAPWPAAPDEAISLAAWASALLIGPGLGREAAAVLVPTLLAGFDGPVVLDADALNAFEGRAAALRPLLERRAAVLTPHPAEFGRLTGLGVDDVLAQRFEAGAALAETAGATVVLKGVPTVVSARDGRRFVSAAGTPALATAGSGDVLGGVLATLLGQGMDAAEAAAVAAWAHGRAAELATVAHRTVRGAVLDDVLAMLPGAWSAPDEPLAYPVLAELPAVGAA